MELSITKLLLILVIVFVIFGAGKLPQVMGSLGKGVRSLKEGLHGDEAKDEKDAVKPVTDARIIEVPPVVVPKDTNV